MNRKEWNREKDSWIGQDQHCQSSHDPGDTLNESAEPDKTCVEKHLDRGGMLYATHYK